jgi:hypothetical protein
MLARHAGQRCVVRSRSSCTGFVRIAVAGVSPARTIFGLPAASSAGFGTSRRSIHQPITITAPTIRIVATIVTAPRGHA